MHVLTAWEQLSFILKVFALLIKRELNLIEYVGWQQVILWIEKLIHPEMRASPHKIYSRKNFHFLLFLFLQLNLFPPITK